MSTILQMQSITKEFPGVKALDDVNLTVEQGEIHAICGENGAGKSTLMKVLSGVYPYGTYTGDIVFEGKVARFHSINESEAAGIVIIHQELALVPHLTVAENIFLGNERRGRTGLIDWNRANHEATDLMNQVGLHENPMTPVSQLGVGKQQLIEIAKALSKEVKLLILDEPTAALNDTDSAHLLDLLRKLKERGITSIMISHKLNEIEAIADTTTVIRDGKTIEALDMSDPDVDQDRIIRGMVGRDLEHRYPEHDHHIGDEVFRVENWTVYHPTQQDRKVIEDASFFVQGRRSGRHRWPDGRRPHRTGDEPLWPRVRARRTPAPSSRTARNCTLRTVSDAIERGIAYATEDRKKYGLNLIDNVRRNISAAALFKLSSNGFVNGNEELKVAEEYRYSMNIKTPTVMQTVSNLSGGNQQKVVLVQVDLHGRRRGLP